MIIKIEHFVLVLWIIGLIFLFINVNISALLWAFPVGTYSRQCYEKLKSE